MNKSSFKMRFGAVLILFLLLVVSVSATVTINNESMSTDDSDLVINFEDGWINTWNATIDNESIDSSVINQWNMGYEHRGDAFFNASDAFDFTWAITSPWNSSVSNPFNQELNTTDDVTFNSVSGDGSSLTGVLSDWTDGDPFYNGSDAFGFTWTMADDWNASATSGAPSHSLIVNSNNNSWTPTGANIQVALDDLTIGGTVWLPSREIITISSEIDMPKETILDGQGCVLKPDASFDMINMSNASIVRNINFDCRGISFTDACILFWGERYINYRHNMTAVEHCIFNSANQDGTAILLTDGHASDGVRASIAWVRVNDIYTRDFKYGIHIESLNTDSPGGTWINGNMFNNLFGFDDEYFIYIDNTNKSGINYDSTETGGNSFTHIMFQPDYHTQHVIYNEGRGNMFTDITIWDWEAKGLTSYSVNLTNTSRDTLIIGNYGLDDNIIDNGVYDDNSIITRRNITNKEGVLRMEYITAPHYNYDALSNVDFFQNSVSGDNQLFSIYGWDTGESATRYMYFQITTAGTAQITTQESIKFDINGVTLLSYGAEDYVSCFEGAGTGENPWFYVWGRDVGDTVREYIGLSWDGTDGQIITSPGGGNITFAPDSGAVNFTDIISLDPIATLPERPHEGMIVMYTGNHTLCCWDGSAWKGFWD